MTPQNRQHADRKAIFILVAALLVLHGLLAVGGVWQKWVWPAVFVSFVLLVMILERLGRLVPENRS